MQSITSDLTARFLEQELVRRGMLLNWGLGFGLLISKK